MKIEGTITKICELKEGVSQTNGNPWSQRNIVVSWNENVKNSDGSEYQKQQSVVVVLRGDMAKNFALPVGTNIQCYVSFKTNDYKGNPIQNIYASGVYVI